jgi:hypothetical protein
MTTTIARTRHHFDPLRFSPPLTKRQEDRETMIAKAAYYLAQRRNFAGGHEVEDWLAAEAEVERSLAQARQANGYW